MSSDDFDREEIDRLVKELSAPPKPTPPPAAPAPDNNVVLTPGSRYSTAKLLMPAERVERRNPFEFLSNVTLPALPKISMPPMPAMPKMPTPALPKGAFSKLPGILIRALPKMTPPTLPKLPTSLAAIDLGALFARFFVGISVLLSAAMPYWPYPHAWSWGLLFYFFAVVLVVIAGIWSAKLTWDARLPAAHTLAVGTIVWGLGLLAAEAVPRIVYA